MPKFLTAGMAALCCLAVLASPAAAKKHSAAEFAFPATIDCGHGPMVVGSGENTSDPFVELKTGRIFQPVEWHVATPGGPFDEVEPDQPKGRRQTCSYDDGVARGTVVVVQMPHGKANGRRR